MNSMADSNTTAARVSGWVTVYRSHDVDNAINLAVASEALSPVAAARARPARGEAQAIQIANPPLSIPLGAQVCWIDEAAFELTFSARVFDFGVCALQARISVAPGLSWEAFGALGPRLENARVVADAFSRSLDRVLPMLGRAVERPELSRVSESYVVFRITTLSSDDGATAAPSGLSDAAIALLLLNESQPLSSGARAELLHHRFSYYEDDLAVLTWDNALVIDPRTADEDVEYVLEFANAQLLELTVYDAALDEELPQVCDRIAAARGYGVATHPTSSKRPLRHVLAGLQTRVADVTETVERAENARKVTDDVYLARLYAGALDLFRATAWRRGIDANLK